MKKIVFISLLFTMSCSTTNNILQSPPKNISFDTEGHLGCRGIMPENTFAAMKTALDLGVTTLEMDVVFTKDKKAILSHEPFFNHEISTKPDGNYVKESEEKSLNIYKMNYDEVKRYDVGLKPHPRFPSQQKLAVSKPLLSDIFDNVQQYMLGSKRPLPYFNIETKTEPTTDNIYHPAPEEFVDLLMAVINEKGLQARVIIQSFDFRTLRYLHTKYPAVKTAMLIEDFDERGLKDQLKSLGFVPTIYSPAYELVNEDLVNKCHEQNIRIIPWTVNSKDKIEALKKMGVDGIISDYPTLFN